jgi:hypothetical protein
MASGILGAVAAARRLLQEKEFRTSLDKSGTAKKAVQKKVVKATKTAKQRELKRLEKEKMRKKAFKKLQASLPKRKLRVSKTKSGQTLITNLPQ